MALLASTMFVVDQRQFGVVYQLGQIQKVITERAQVQAIGVDADSVIGKQKSLYQAQTDGFKRDAEQKAAKLMVDSWNIRRTTDEATVADQTNMLADSVVGRAVAKMLAGVGA